MQRVNVRPRQFATAYTVHRRTIAPAPVVRKTRPIYTDATRCTKRQTSRMRLPRQSTTVPKTSNVSALTWANILLSHSLSLWCVPRVDRPFVRLVSVL